jgi:hypothetical protein
MALDLFENGYETSAFEANGFYSSKDFAEFGEKIGVEKQKIGEFFKSVSGKIPIINELLENSALSGAAIAKYKEYVAERARMLEINH